jgi:hypothetical protein
LEALKGLKTVNDRPANQCQFGFGELGAMPQPLDVMGLFFPHDSH